ncbi:MAG TPA: hypothetical protein PK239_11555 [Chitinophagales bacterium]|nr:hypothetical protein [Chitinophagales bacterium]HRK27905.1 hypothetical protein [Chitinophagales bacterium]
MSPDQLPPKENSFERLPDIVTNKRSEEPEFIWCLVGNIIDEHYFGEHKEVKRGTKHFLPNTKVYCFPSLWGDGYEDVKVIGRHRKSKTYISIIMPSKYITNWRIQKVYSPYIRSTMQANYGWRNSDEDKNVILGMLEWLPDRTEIFKPKPDV